MKRTALVVFGHAWGSQRLRSGSRPDGDVSSAAFFAGRLTGTRRFTGRRVWHVRPSADETDIQIYLW